MDIYSLNVNEKTTINGIIILRVPGGWIYTFQNDLGSHSVFVPYIEEEEYEKSN